LSSAITRAVSPAGLFEARAVPGAVITSAWAFGMTAARVLASRGLIRALRLPVSGRVGSVIGEQRR